jgi:hypothetical protein
MTTRTTPAARRSDLGRAARFLLAAGVAWVLGGCNQGGEGQMCHSLGDAGDQSQCNQGLSCQTPRGCTASYCCPTPASLSTNANCNGTSCASN